MNRGTRLAIVAGIIIAVAAVAIVMAIPSAPSNPEPPTNNGNSTNGEPRQITVDLNESLSVEAK